MKTVLYLIRHGQSMANLLGKFVGHTDYPLSSLGEKQAELTADYFKNINSFDYFEEFNSINKEYVEKVLKELFIDSKKVVSVIKPNKEEDK